jgi:hypothetical protein
MAQYLPEDLAPSTASSVPPKYFEIVVNDLQLNTPYNFQFAWIIPNQTTRVWSATKQIITPTESAPNTPSGFTVENNTPGYLKITWDGKDDSGNLLVNVARVDIYIDGAPFDGSKPADYFLSAGTKTITAPAGTYIISGYSVSKLGTVSPVADPVTRTVIGIGTPIIPTVNPSVPTLTTGLASVIVSWDGKTSAGSNFEEGSFAGAKVYIGTDSNFTPSNNNWVHSLNFANGSNQVSIGVGTIIDKSTTPKTKLTYETPYFVKLGTVNANGDTTGTFISASPASVSVSKLPASEISTGILNADASITAGAEFGARVVLSGGADPFSIYGTNGTTKLLNFYLGDENNDATLSITGSGTFSGDISAATGTLSNALNIGTAVGGVYPFSVSSSGFIDATAGTIGGWTLGEKYLINSSSTFRIQSVTDTVNGKYKAGIILGSVTSPYLEITADGIIHRKSDGTASGIFSLTTSSETIQISGNIIQGGSAGYVQMLKSTPGQIDFVGPGMDAGYIKMSSLKYGLYYGLSIKTPKPTDATGTSPYIDFSALKSEPGYIVGEALIHGGSLPLILDSDDAVQIDGYNFSYPEVQQRLSHTAQLGSITEHARTLTITLLEGQDGSPVGRIGYGRALIYSSSASPSDSIGNNGDLLFSTA